ncbi:MAG: winged helix-turn-helix domain-containing protein, partial [Parasporobacterium sp.]|nr:winged helix-turn-helix domain-containing protein [Parasporobacterium sp.]
MKDYLNVRLFGGMYIEGLGGQLTIETLRSPMLAKLLVYLLCHHKDQCSVQEMVDALWPDESSDNPAGALKNLVYRLRKILSTIWPEYDLVITGKGYYSWNPEISLVMDTEVFEDLKQQSLSEKDPDKLIGICTQMTEQYKGRMFAGFDDTYWIASLGTYYFSAYEDSVIKL